jgi:DNA invertase Pin-like site-specific DNA recombinase
VNLVEIRRVSSQEQAGDDRAGLQRQESENARTAARLGAQIVRTFVLSDVSRTSFTSTPEWREINTLIEHPDVHIVADSLDRVVADFEGFDILKICKRTNTKIYTSSGDFDLNTIAGRYVGTILALKAGDELGDIRHRVQGAKEAKRREGIFPSGDISLPTGIAYIRSKGQRAGRWTYNEEITRVREVFRLVVHEGIHNFRGVGKSTGFSGQTVRNILKNAIYKGLWLVTKKRAAGPTPVRADGRRKDRQKVDRAPHERIEYQAYRARGVAQEPGDLREEAAVDESTWEAAQSVLAEKREHRLKVRQTPENTRFVYTSLAWCHACNAPMYGQTRKVPDGHRDYYACRQILKHGCPTRYLRRHDVNVALDRLFTQVLSDERFLRGLVQTRLDQGRVDHADKITSIKKDAERIRGKRAKLLDLYLDDQMPRADLDRKRSELDGQLERLDREVRRLEEEQAASASASALEGLRDALVALHEYEFWSPLQKRGLLQKFFPRIYVSRRGVETVQVRLPVVGRVGGREIGVGEHEVPLDVQVGMTWGQLTPSIEMTDFGLPQREFYTRRDIKKLLGWSEWMMKDRTAKGILLEPKKRKGDKRAWTADEVRELLVRVKAGGEPGRWGLPKKASYSSGEVAHIVGVTWEQLRYAIEKGKATDCAARDREGHRIWTEAEVERLVGEFEARVSSAALLPQ